MAKYTDDYVRSAGILTLSRERPATAQRAGRMPTPQRVRRPRYVSGLSRHFAILGELKNFGARRPPLQSLSLADIFTEIPLRFHVDGLKMA